MSQILVYVVQFLLHIVTVLFIARFLLQACRADFYNPISQGIVKATDPVLKPLRMILPGYRNLDLASFLAAVLAQVLLVFALTAITGQAYQGTVLRLASFGLVKVVLFILAAYKYGILIVIVAGFLAPGSYHPALTLLHQLTEPVLAPARKLIPALGGLDFSPILVFLLIGVLEQAVMLLYR